MLNAAIKLLGELGHMFLLDSNKATRHISQLFKLLQEKKHTNVLVFVGHTGAGKTALIRSYIDPPIHIPAQELQQPTQTAIEIKDDGSLYSRIFSDSDYKSDNKSKLLVIDLPGDPTWRRHLIEGLKNYVDKMGNKKRVYVTLVCVVAAGYNVPRFTEDSRINFFEKEELVTIDKIESNSVQYDFSKAYKSRMLKHDILMIRRVFDEYILEPTKVVNSVIIAINKFDLYRNTTDQNTLDIMYGQNSDFQSEIQKYLPNNKIQVVKTCADFGSELYDETGNKEDFLAERPIDGNTIRSLKADFFSALKKSIE